MIERHNVLVVDDEVNATNAMLRQLKSMDIKLIVCNDTQKAVEYIKTNRVDLLITDYMMPIFNGVALIKYVKTYHPHALAILITGVGDFELAVNAVNQGIVFQFITKPYNPKYFVKQVKDALRKVEDNIDFKKYRDWSFSVIGTEEADEVSEILENNTIGGLLNLMYAKDEDLLNHSINVSEMAKSFTKYLKINDQVSEHVFTGALMHDIGKLAIKDQILDKPSKLEQEEIIEMKNHPIVGANLLYDLGINNQVIAIVRHHHEKWDGSGYPDMLKKDSIEIGSRIVCVIDTYDALRTERSYKKAMTLEKTKQIMLNESGKIFDSEILEAFFQFLSVYEGE